METEIAKTVPNSRMCLGLHYAVVKPSFLKINQSVSLIMNGHREIAVKKKLASHSRCGVKTERQHNLHHILTYSHPHYTRETMPFP